MTSVRMPDELLDQLERAAEKLRRSKDRIINDAVKEYLIREERREETCQALSDIKAGRVVNGEEVMDWLESWGSGVETTPPTL